MTFGSLSSSYSCYYIEGVHDCLPLPIRIMATDNAVFAIGIPNVKRRLWFTIDRKYPSRLWTDPTSYRQYMNVSQLPSQIYGEPGCQVRC
ncbi:uncharacterized protein TrAtP1_003798 [Trichoderma atroviride]|uniref:uncharacterized protein n=1 Tax=Hypocrea atroviridis TaxID=63577 RepID=UPI003322D798|nr:hypothetical protein TrAtP1_003798 [Trichoderma atroviride]